MRHYKTMQEQLDCIVIGAGVVGLAIARRLAIPGMQVIVLETEDQPGMHASSRNSEVIHAGIYYPKDSLKARLCVAGREMLYRYCEARHIPYSRLGKLIVGVSADDEEKLQQIEMKANANGVTDLQWLTKKEIASREPSVRASLALLSPSTGIIDSHSLILSLHADLENLGGTVACQNKVASVVAEDDGFVVSTEEDPLSPVRCKNLINAAGLWAPDIAHKIAGLESQHVPKQYLAKGHYYSYQGSSPFSQLIYPLPSDGGLGIHVTQDMAGAARFGPDVNWIDTIDYQFDESRKAEFVAAIRRYFPDLNAGKLVPGYTGIRAKLSGAGDEPADFMIDGPEVHGIPGLVNLFGIESPGLTASLAIGDLVHTKLMEAV